MISKFRGTVKKLGAENLKLRIVESDILKFDELEAYDMVVANFFWSRFIDFSVASSVFSLFFSFS